MHLLPLVALAAVLGEGFQIDLSDPDGDGVFDVRIVVDDADQRVLVDDTTASGLSVSIDFNGDGDFDDVGDLPLASFGSPVEQIFVAMGGGDDVVEYRFLGAHEETVRALHVDLGKGNDRLELVDDAAAMEQCALSFEVVGGPGDDTLDYRFNTLIASSIVVRADLGAGNDAVDASTLGGNFAGSLMDARIVLGPGKNQLVARLSAVIAPGPALSGALTRSVFVAEGGPQKDELTIQLDDRMTDDASLEVELRGNGGNDQVVAVVGGAGFGIENLDGDEEAGRARIVLRGGDGNDDLRVTRLLTGEGLRLDGLLELEVDAGAGNDSVEVDADVDFFTVESAAAQRGFALRVDGGKGKDAIRCEVSGTDEFPGPYDLAISGGDGDDSVEFSLENGGSPSFGFAGAVLLDGGAGKKDALQLAGDAPVSKRRFELLLP